MQKPTQRSHLHLTTLICLFFLLLHLPYTIAEIKTVAISSDSRPTIRFEEFGFTKTGHVSVTASSISIPTTTILRNSSRLGFFVSPIDFYLDILDIQNNPKVCILDNPNVYLLFTFRDLSPFSSNPSLHKTVPITIPNGYDLFFANCAPQTSISMVVHIETYNLDSNGHKDYLPAGQTQLPTIYFLFAILYFPILVLWIYICHRNKPFAHKIHLLIALLLLLKAINMLCAAEDKRYVKVTGTPHGWDNLYYASQFVRALLWFTVIVLIGAGWSYLKPSLQEEERNVLMIGLPLQVLANTAWIIVNETGPFFNGWEFWVWVFVIVDIVCCFIVFIPIAWNIQSLKEAAKADGKSAMNMARLRLFRDFYVALYLYMYVSRSMVFGIKMDAPYIYQWMSNAIEETASFLLHMVMIYMLRPMEKNEYFVLDDAEEEAALAAIQSDEFDLPSPILMNV